MRFACKSALIITITNFATPMVPGCWTFPPPVRGNLSHSSCCLPTPFLLQRNAIVHPIQCETERKIESVSNAPDALGMNFVQRCSRADNVRLPHPG